MTDEEKKEEVVGIEVTPGKEWVESVLEGQENLNKENLYHYVCEVCGKEQDLTEDEAFKAGWDYPPFIGMWGVLSPRTCPNCTIDKTAYWHVITRGTQDIPENHMATIKRVMAERSPTNG
jgi:rubrerythrin